MIDATAGAPERQARALGAFLREGLSGATGAETVLVYDDERERERLVALAPTRQVRLVRALGWSPATTAASLAAAARVEATRLFLFAGGAAGAEVVTRLARRSGGAVLTDALSLEVKDDRLVGRRNVYSAHLVGRFELTALPWCVSLDPGWDDAPEGAPVEHDVAVLVAAGDGDDGGPEASPLEDVERIDLPAAGAVARSRFLVVAGRGAGSREGVERIAAAARSMGADFAVSRPVAMNAWAPLDRLVGVSGARSSPRLCIVAGASGAPAFFWGVEKAAFIAAVDLDAQAPVMRQADAAVVGDAVEVLEELARIVVAERTRD